MPAFTNADILLPKDTELEKWACIACDQFTGEREYWENVEKETADSFSAYELILPEVYLNDKDVGERIEKIHEKMRAYIDSGVFEEYKNALVYVERVQTDGRVRAGIVGAVDLEEYDYSKGSHSKIRATEATVEERIPPRVKIRENAPIELPHIMILIDDVKDTVIGPLGAKKDDMKKLYGFELMSGGGSIEGWLIPESEQKRIFSELEKLSDKSSFNERYGLDGSVEPLVFAMGDGNHSLATAKSFYERLKSQIGEEAAKVHPARYALAEIVDLHSPALEFEAIHRIVENTDTQKLMSKAREVLGLEKADSLGADGFGAVINGGIEYYKITRPTSRLAVGSLQNFLDGYLKENSGASVDYIHGEDVVKRLSMRQSCIGFILPDMGKQELFPTVIADGALPRKTFSMGTARDKRYYIEARKIQGDET